MRIATFVCIVLVLGFSAPVVAQVSALQPGGKGELEKWVGMPASTTGVNRPCGGAYFIYSDVSAVTFSFHAVNDAGDRAILTPTFVPEDGRMQIRLVNNLKVPTAEVVNPIGGKVLPWVELSISPSDLKRSVCLASFKMTKTAAVERASR